MRYPPFKSCPCGSGRSFASCCGPRLSGETPAETPEALMRSRYTAFFLRDGGYLLATWHPDTRPGALDLSGDRTRWLGLKVLWARDDRVSFRARYEDAQGRGELREVSRFVQEDGRWLYLDGRVE